MLGRLPLLSLAITCACAATPKPVEEPAAAQPAAISDTPHVENTAPQRHEEDARRLPEQATFGDLVQAAVRLDDASATHSASGCLIRIRDGVHLEADLSLAARPLPGAPERVLEGALARATGVSVITTWGSIPGAADDAVLVAFTTTSLPAFKLPAIGVFATRAGVLLRSPDPLLRGETSALSPEDAGSRLARVSTPATVYVTAERDVSVRTLLTLLTFIPNRFEVALAVALPSSARLPQAPNIDAREGLCESGLPAPNADEPEGELTVAAAQSAIAPLRDAALSCALQAGGRALLGGKLVLALRVAADGRARQVCFPTDAIREPLLRRCLISTVRDLSLPRPSPAGFADLQIPLHLELTGPAPQRAACD